MDDQMSVPWEVFAHCRHCIAPKDAHHESCPYHPLGWQGRLDIEYIVEDGISEPDELNRVLDFARAVIESKVYRITQPCPECGSEFTRICVHCDHPASLHDDTLACKMFPQCDCAQFEARECREECRGGRVIPEALIDAALIEMPPLGETSDSIARAHVREALFSVEAVAQQLVEEPQP